MLHYPKVSNTQSCSVFVLSFLSLHSTILSSTEIHWFDYEDVHFSTLVFFAVFKMFIPPDIVFFKIETWCVIPCCCRIFFFLWHIFYRRTNICQLSFWAHYLSFSPWFSHTNVWTTPRSNIHFLYKTERGYLNRKINLNESISAWNWENEICFINTNACDRMRKLLEVNEMKDRCVITVWRDRIIFDLTSSFMNLV